MQYRGAAQTCHPEADFAFSLNGCTGTFNTGYGGPGTVVSHLWKFYHTPGSSVFSTSTVEDPVFTFYGFNATKRVFHEVVVSLNGVNTAYECTKDILTGCTNNSECVFNYDVERCTLSVRNTGTYNFGDGSGSVSVTTVPYVHTYAAPGVYTVTRTIFGQSCPSQVSIGTCPPSTCCNANFTAQFHIDCSALMLLTNPVCEGGKWEILSPCIKSVGNIQSDIPIQITNINTDITPALLLRYTVTCDSGRTVKVEKSIPVPSGVFIGEINANTVPLTDYECALPGNAYNGNLKVYTTGIITIDKNFTFNHTTVKVHPGLNGFNVEAQKNFSLLNGTDMSSTCDCLWRGMYVWGNLVINASSVFDALYAIRTHNGCSISVLANSLLARNFIAIRSTEEAFSYSRTLRESSIDGAGPLKAICGLEAHKQDIRAFTAYSESEGVVPYNTERGYAGIYVRKNANFKFGTFQSAQFRFRNLAVGLDIYDTDTQIGGQPRFSHIRSGSYLDYGTAGLRFTDTPEGGSNSLSYTGRALSGGIDFEKTTIGIYVYSQIPGKEYTGTNLNLARIRMTGMQTGILLFSRRGTFSGGEGNPNPLFKGIYENVIDATDFAENDGGNHAVGIYNASTSISYLEIYKNVFNAGAGFNGITSSSLDFGHQQFQYTMFSNRINLQNNSNTGITVEGARNFIYNHGTNSPYSGTGIYIGPDGSQPPSLPATGLSIQQGSQSVVFCNDIISQSPSATLLQVYTQTNGIYMNNLLQGPGIGAQFVMPCGSSTAFLSNTMKQNTLGLSYVSGAATGPQGNQTYSSGNRWEGPPTTRAFSDDVSVTSTSRYFVKPGEGPVNVNITGWFNLASGNPPFTVSCPGASLSVPPAEVNTFDSLVVANAIPYPTEYAAATRWWNERNLYEKLVSNPGLTADNALMSSFTQSRAGTPSAQLINARKSISTVTDNTAASFAALADQDKNAIKSAANQAGINDTTALMITDTALALTLKTAQETAAAHLNDWKAATEQGLIPLRATVANIAPSNLFENNEKWLLLFYLDYPAKGLQPSAAQLEELKTLGQQCPLVAGPAAAAANSLYKLLTTKALPRNTCTVSEERMQRQAELTPLISIYPNPAREYITVQLQQQPHQNDMLFTLHNHTGQVILQQTLTGVRNTVSTGALQNGLYFATVTKQGKVISNQKIVILH